MSKTALIKDLMMKKVLKSDDFIQKLCYANAGMLTVGNIWCFDHAISHLPSQAPIIEIGSFCGLSANLMTYLKFKHGVTNKLICTDPWDFDEGDRDGSLGEHPYLKNQEYTKFVKESFIRNISLFSSHDLPFAVQSTSDNFFAKWKQEQAVNDVLEREIKLGGKISFAHIDGNHSYEFARRDFINVDKFLEIGGFILFDDSGDGSDWEVCQVVAEVSDCGRYEIVKKSPNYLFKKIKNEGDKND